MRKSILYHSCENMQEVNDRSARLVIISPPLTDTIREQTLNKSRYREFISKVLLEVHRILAPDGILVTVNTDLRDHSYYNQGNPDFNGTVWFKHSDLRIEAEHVGFKCLDCKIWVKSFNINVYRYNFAYIMFFCEKDRKPFRPGTSARNHQFKTDVWFLKGGTQRVTLNGFRFRSAIHPEIAERCITEFTKPGDLVVSPFTGSGTILAVAEIMGRDWVGYEIDENLRDLINESIYGPTRPSVYKDILTRYNLPDISQPI